MKNKIVIDIESINTILTSANDLLETDMLHTKILHSLQNTANLLFETYELTHLLKRQGVILKTIVQSYQNLVSSSMQKAIYYTKQIPNTQKSSVFTSFKINNEKILGCLSKFVPSYVIKQGIPSDIELNLSEKFKFDAFDGLSTLYKVKKYKNCCENYKSLVTSIGKDLLSLYNTNLAEIFNANPELTSFDNRDPSPTIKKTDDLDSKKLIVGKVNRLLNRGSLTKEEAKRVILSLNKSEIIPSQLEFLQNTPQHRLNDEDPLTETRVKPGGNLSSFHSELDKVFRYPKKPNKSCSTLKRRRSFNSAFSRNHSSSFIKTGLTTSKPRSKSKMNII